MMDFHTQNVKEARQNVLNRLQSIKSSNERINQPYYPPLITKNRSGQPFFINKDDSKHAEEWISGSSDPVTSALNASIAVKRSHEIKRPTDQNSTINKKNVSFNEGNNEEILYEKERSTGAETFTQNDTPRDNQQLSFLSKLKRTNTMNRGISNVDTIPLDDFMTEYEEDGTSGDDIIQLFVDEKPRDVRDSRDYDKLDEKINKIQTYLETVKQTQDKILELLANVERK